MKPIYDFSDTEVLKAFDKAFNATTLEEKQREKGLKRRIAKADFFNLKEVTKKENLCIFNAED